MGNASELRPHNFFYRYLTVAPGKDIVRLLHDLERQRDQIEEEVIDIAFFMKGGVTLLEAWQLSHLQRAKIAERVSKHNRDMHGGPEYL